MASRLSSLLVRDGLVGVKRMEKAFQRQVIYGGNLDTILLEMMLVPEDRLSQYLALASGLPPAARDDGAAIDPELTALIDPELAAHHRAVPLRREGEALQILVCAPIDLEQLADLADVLDRPLQPLITPEYRWYLAYARAYGVEPPARFTTLARTLEVDPAIPPVGRPPSVIVDRASLEPAPPPVVVDQGTAPMVPAPVAAPRDDDDPPRAKGSPRPRPAVDQPTEPMVVIHVVPGARPHATKTVRQRPATPSLELDGRDAPMSVARAREQLATAADRDAVFLTLLRAARSRARWAGLLTIQGGAAIGRLALAEPGLDVAQVHSVLIPLDVVSAFRAAVSSHQPHIGPLASGDAAIDGMVQRFGGTLPPSGLLLPIVLRDRVVAVVVAHRVHSELRLSDVTELLPLATAASDALGRLIVKHKAAGYRAPTDPPVIEIEADQVATKRIVRAPGTWQPPERPPTLPGLEQGLELSIVAEPGGPSGGAPARPIDEVLDELEATREGRAATALASALAEALERAPETIEALMRRFPGKLRVERFSVAGRPLRAAQYGGLLELVIGLGGVASELLIEKLTAPQRDIRFYAVVCCVELRPPSAMFALVERLFDQDFGVRACAIEALAGYPLHDLAPALARARRAVHSEDPDVVAAATSAIVALGDLEAIPDLIGVSERADRGGDHVRRALAALTAQDFGPNEKKWRRWYDGARRRHRIEWLIEGLVHKEDAIRELAIDDLRRLTGEYFGYHHDLPRRERDLAAERWVTWWRDVGQRRYAHRDDERGRPTAVLPARTPRE